MRTPGSVSTNSDKKGIKQMAYVIKVDGTIESLGPKPKLKQLQEAVGGYIEGLYSPTGFVGYANEEGLLMGLPLNVEATTLFGHPIVGDIVVLEEGDEDEE
jgi:hypothetical protein